MKSKPGNPIRVEKREVNRFLDEVGQQPAVLRELATRYGGDGKTLLKRWAALAKGNGRVVFSGMGTSEYVADAVMAGLGDAGVDATAVDAGELRYYPRSLKGVLVLISQSGESIETRKVAERRAGRCPLVAITNDPQSSLARAAELVLPMCAGTEASITTKTYSNTLAVLFLMLQAARAPVHLAESLHRLADLAERLPTVASEEIRRAASLLADAAALHFVTRGPAMAAARQAALTFAEGTRISTTAFTGGGFRHGPFEMVDEHHRCVFLVPGGATFELLKSMATEVAVKGSRVVAITDQELALPAETCQVLQVPDFGEELFPLAASTTQELLLDAMATRRGLRTGEFRHGQKVTIKE